MCSLVPDEDRLAMVISLRIDPGGETREVKLRAAVIHSHRRLSYEQVAAELGPEATVVTVLCDTGERYFSLDEYFTADGELRP